jgi:hypothetical protein
LFAGALRPAAGCLFYALLFSPVARQSPRGRLLVGLFYALLFRRPQSNT